MIEKKFVNENPQINYYLHDPDFYDSIGISGDFYVYGCMNGLVGSRRIEYCEIDEFCANSHGVNVKSH